MGTFKGPIGAPIGPPLGSPVLSGTPFRAPSAGAVVVWPPVPPVVAVLGGRLPMPVGLQLGPY